MAWEWKLAVCGDNDGDWGKIDCEYGGILLLDATCDLKLLVSSVRSEDVYIRPWRYSEASYVNRGCRNRLVIFHVLHTAFQLFRVRIRSYSFSSRAATSKVNKRSSSACHRVIPITRRKPSHFSNRLITQFYLRMHPHESVWMYLNTIGYIGCFLSTAQYFKSFDFSYEFSFHKLTSKINSSHEKIKLLRYRIYTIFENIWSYISLRLAIQIILRIVNYTRK